VDCEDGLHLGFDDGFLMWRASGTEAVVRVYAEAPDSGALARRLDDGVRLLVRRARA
jgi:phosphomannomutase